MAHKSLRRGLFITFEGPEGCGKSTQSKLVYEYLTGAGYDCIYMREPGGTRAGERIRQILLNMKGISLTDTTELLLFEAARSQIVEELIRPAIKAKRIVICDRFSDATLAYQGYGGKVPLATIQAVDKIATCGLTPNLTVLFDIDTATGLSRAKAKGIDRMEAKDSAYHRRVRKGYIELAKKHPNRIKVIKVTGNIGEIHGLVRCEVDRVVQRYKGTG